MRSRLFVLLAVGLASGVLACGETLNTSNTCPLLCPSQDVTVRDTVIAPVLVFDSTYTGFPDRGDELGMLLTTRGDTVEVRGVVRFDSLAYSFLVTGDTAHTVVSVDSTRLRIVLDTTQKMLLPASVRFEVYDVDDETAPDTVGSAVLAKFTKARLLGQLTVLKDSLQDTVRVPVSDSAVLSKIKAHTRLRLGIRVDGSGPVSLVAKTIESGITPVLSYKVSADTAIKPLFVSPLSSTPTAEPEIQNSLLDYQLVAKYQMPSAPSATMAVGGVPGRRAYLRFDLPRRITDSSTVVRATLRLTQVSVPFGGAKDTITVHVHPVLASAQVTDLRRASTIIAAAGSGVYDSLLIAPRDAGLRSFEMYGLVRSWGAQDPNSVNPVPRSVVLRASNESLSASEIRFYGTTAAAALRPTMRISYIPKITFGVP